MGIYHLVLALRSALVLVHAQFLGSRVLGLALALALVRKGSIGSIGGGVVGSSVVTHCELDVKVVVEGQGLCVRIRRMEEGKMTKLERKGL